MHGHGRNVHLQCIKLLCAVHMLCTPWQKRAPTVSARIWVLGVSFLRFRMRTTFSHTSLRPASRFLQITRMTMHRRGTTKGNNTHSGSRITSRLTKSTSSMFACQSGARSSEAVPRATSSAMSLSSSSWGPIFRSASLARSLNCDNISGSDYTLGDWLRLASPIERTETGNVPANGFSCSQGFSKLSRSGASKAIDNEQFRGRTKMMQDN